MCYFYRAFLRRNVLLAVCGGTPPAECSSLDALLGDGYALVFIGSAFECNRGGRSLSGLAGCIGGWGSDYCGPSVVELRPIPGSWREPPEFRRRSYG